MQLTTQKILFLGAGLLLGFFAGFVLTDYSYRQIFNEQKDELARLRSQAAATNLPANGVPSPDGLDSLPNLTEEQLRTAVARADASPQDAGLQRISGQALYVYARQKGNHSILPDVIRLLKRAYDANPEDFLTTLMLGDALAMTEQSGADSTGYEQSRKYYQQAIRLKPGDANAHVSLGLTYFFDRPPEPKLAVREYRKALDADPRNELAMQHLVAALTAAGEFEEAERRLEELEKLNPSNVDLANLRAGLEQKKNAAGGQD